MKTEKVPIMAALKIEISIGCKSAKWSEFQIVRKTGGLILFQAIALSSVSSGISSMSSGVQALISLTS